MPAWANGRRNRVRRRRWPRLTLWLVATAAIALAVYLAGPAEPPAENLPLTGKARIVDGDTLALGSTRIRLAGIDAPERGQSCGETAAAWPCGERAEARLGELARTEVSCQPEDRDRWGRLVAVCRSEGADLGDAMVRAGLALSVGRYEAAEAEARAAGRGIWAGPFVAPAQWRRLTGGDAGLGQGPSRLEVLIEWLVSWFPR
jgi:endonuclease YncB( thermonuclease family)